MPFLSAPNDILQNANSMKDISFVNVSFLCYTDVIVFIEKHLKRGSI